MLTLIDEHTCQCLAIKVARSPKSEDVVQVLVKAIEVYGRPQCIRSDKGSQFEAQKVREASSRARSILSTSTLAALWQNGHVESFNHRRRDVPRNVVIP